MSHNVASDASRPRTASSARILISSSNSRPKSQHDQKRPDPASPRCAGTAERSDGSAMVDLLRSSITIKPHPPKLSVKPRSLQPLMLLPRENLQLSFLQLSSPSGSFEASRFYESKIKILDLEDRMGARPVVLLARLESDKSTYALERQRGGLYTICQVGPWVDLRSLCGLATACRPQLLEERRHGPSESAESQPLTTPHLHDQNKKRRLAIEAIQSIVKRPARSGSISATLPQPDASQLPTPTETDNTDAAQTDTTGKAPTLDEHTAPNGIARPPSSEQQIQQTLDADAVEEAPRVVGQDEALHTQPTADDIFSNIRNQYQEALYHSMGSLAYFAKGPLSRARAAFHLDCDSILDMNDLIDFLNSLVMNTVQIDKKYRETIPAITAKMVPVIHDSENERDAAPKGKKRKVKKMRIGKDGLYPMEEDHIKRWWAVHRPRPKEDDEFTTASLPEEAKLQLSSLRSRETQLQMIIILEVLALEPLRASGDSQLPGLPGPGETDADLPSKQLPVKKRNRHNLPFLLDVHADRLSIWQSTALDEIKALEESQNPQKLDSQNPQRATDPLKDFCIDIIVPFFSARLPEQCDSINRKLGGPIKASPPKPKPKNPEASAKKSKPRPGTVAKRPAPLKASRTLDNVLSKESERNRRSISRGPGSAIALMRSASTSTVPMLKREASDSLSLASIPRADSPASLESQSTTGPAPGPTKRRFGDDRAKKDALVKAELENAISALRKPNRDVVGKAMEEAAQRRTITSLSQLKKSKKPTQYPRSQGVVKATPAGARFRDAFAGDVRSQPLFSRQPADILEADHIPSSSSLIPSSAPRKRAWDSPLASLDESPVIPGQALRAPAAVAEHIDATPARPSNLRRNLLAVPELDESAILASSPVLSRKIAQPKFPPRKSESQTLYHDDSGIGMPSSPTNNGGVGMFAETPVKSRVGAMASLQNYITVTPVKKRFTGVENEMSEVEFLAGKQDEMAPVEKPVSIFQRLGWDDDLDDLA